MCLGLLCVTAGAATPPGIVISNQAHVSYTVNTTNLSMNSNVATVTVVGQSDSATIAIAGDYPINYPGDVLNLSTTLTNTGTTALNNGSLTFNIPASTTITAGAGVTLQLNNGTVTATVPDIAAGATLTMQFSLKLPLSAPPGVTNVNFTYDANNTSVAAGQYSLKIKAHVPAQASFMRVDTISGSPVSIPVTQYKNASGVFVDIAAPPVITGGSQLVTDAPLPLAASQTFHKNKTLFIRIDDQDLNRDPAAVENLTIGLKVIDSAGTVGDDEVIRLNETGANTGQFVGYIVGKQGVATANDGSLSVTAGSRVKATYIDNSDGDNLNFDVQIDPYGVVFNSKTGQPIDGVTVSMIDRDTGLPAAVIGDDGVSSFPSTIVTGGSVSDASGQVYNMPPGSFRFPLAPPGNYQLAVTLPAGSSYAWPSQAATADLQALPGGPFAIDVGSRGETFVLQAGPPLHLDIPIDPIGAGLFVTKSANRQQVAPGDFLQYSVTVRDASALTPVNGVVVTDILPHGFKYRQGSLTIDDTTAADPTLAADGRTMTIPVGDIAASGSTSLKYVVEVAASGEGEAENRASAGGALGETSNTATARVTVREDLMHSHSLILGEVTATSADDTAQGIPGVRIYLEDGSYTVTDDKGKYHFEGVRPGTHVVQLDATTLPQQYDLMPPDNDRFAGRGWSQFVDIQGGTLWRADFKVKLKDKPTGSAAVTLESLLDLDRKSIYYKAELHSTHVPLGNVRLTVLLPKGAHYVANSSSLNGEQGPEPTVMDNMLVYRLGDQASDWNALLQFATRLDTVEAPGDSVTKAVMTVDTPDRKSASTPAVEVDLKSHDVVTGREHKHYVMRWQFGSMEAALDNDARRQLNGLIGQLTGLQNITVKVTGYSDNLPIRSRSRGLFKDNLALSAARAESTAQYLRNVFGLETPAITVAAMGDKDPLASNATANGRALNRRVEIEVDAERSVHKKLLIDGQRQSAGEQMKISGPRPGDTRAQPIAVADEKTDPASQFDDKWLETTAPGIDWMMPAPGYLPSAPFVHIGIKHYPQQKVEAWINGAPVGKAHFESTHVNAAHTVAYSWWRGVGLKDGDNQVEIAVIDADGKVAKRMRRTIHYSRAPIKAEFVAARSSLTADGITQPVIAVRLTDRDGFPARDGVSGEFAVAPPYTADTKLPEDYAVMPGAPADKPHYTVGKDGIALIRLQPTTQAGEVKLTLPLINGDAEIVASLKPALRDWILVGFAEGTVGYNSLKGSVQPLGDNADKQDIYQDGRVALYAKGRVKGDWLMTFAYDTGKQKNNSQIYQTIDPGSYYTVYGDNGAQRYDAASADKLYIKLEKDTFYALFGDYDTGLQDTRLFTYNRSLTGLKSRYKDDRYEAVVFASESNQGFIKDEIRGQGISGPYQLSRKTIVINSEKVHIQVRDRFRSEVIVSEKYLSQHVDYDIDYVNGTLSFREPVLSVDENLNPMFIIVDYESYDGQNFSMTYGGRGQARVNDKIQAGVTHINEGRVGGNARLDAVDGTYQINEYTQARVELAHSSSRDNSVDESGDAYLAEIDHRAPLTDLKAYVSRYDQGFGVGQYNGSENATRKIGAEGVYHANHRTDVNGLAYHQDNLATDASRDVVEAETRYRAGGNTELHLGLQAARDKLGNDQSQSSTLLTTGVNQKFLDRRLTVHADRDQAIGEAQSVDFPSRTRLGADYLITDKTRLFAEQEFTNGKDRDTQTTIMGVKTVPWTGSEAFTSVSQKQDGASDNTSADMGLRQRIVLNARWSMDAGVEKSKTVNGSNVAPFNSNVPFASGNEGDFTATSLGVTYNPGDSLWNARGEYRDSSTGDQWNLLSSAQTRVGNDLGLLAALSLSDANLTSGHLFNGKLSLGMAYRPLESKWLVLDKLDYVRDLKEQTVDAYESRRWVNNLNANYHPDPRWQSSLQYGSKFVTDTLDGKKYDAYLDLTGIETRYDFAKAWDVGVRGSVLHAWSAHQYDYSYGASLGYSFATNIWLSVGYNLRGFYDQDFSQSHFTSQGPYLQARMKFDQSSLKDILDKGFR